MHAIQQSRAAWLAALATGLFWVEWGLARGALSQAGGPVPWAVAFDLLITFPVAYAWLVLRPASRPVMELAPVLGLSWVFARIALDRSSQLHAPLHAWSAALELAVVGALGYRCASLFRGQREQSVDVLFHVQQVREPWLRAVGLELCVFYYALVARVRQTERPTGQVFDTGRSARQLLIALGMLSVLEASALHVILQAYWPTFAWVMLALSAYGLLWIIAAYRASRMRPLLVLSDRILVRVSLLFSVNVDRAEISHVEPYTARDREPAIARVTFATAPNVLITLRSPAAIYGLFGRVKRADRIALHVDEPQALLQALSFTS